jgi:hypothetical protein
MTAKQPATDRCDCGHTVDISATTSPHEFDWACRKCSRRGVISWAHAHTPPVYQGETRPLLELTHAR